MYVHFTTCKFNVKQKNKENKKMDKTLTPHMVKRLWKKMESRAALAAHLKISENTIRRWDNGKVDVNKSGYRFELARLMFKYGIS